MSTFLSELVRGKGIKNLACSFLHHENIYRCFQSSNNPMPISSSHLVYIRVELTTLRKALCLKHLVPPSVEGIIAAVGSNSHHSE